MVEDKDKENLGQYGEKPKKGSLGDILNYVFDDIEKDIKTAQDNPSKEEPKQKPQKEIPKAPGVKVFSPKKEEKNPEPPKRTELPERREVLSKKEQAEEDLERLRKKRQAIIDDIEHKKVALSNKKSKISNVGNDDPTINKSQYLGIAKSIQKEVAKLNNEIRKQKEKLEITNGEIREAEKEIRSEQRKDADNSPSTTAASPAPPSPRTAPESRREPPSPPVDDKAKEKARLLANIADLEDTERVFSRDLQKGGDPKKMASLEFQLTKIKATIKQRKDSLAAIAAGRDVLPPHVDSRTPRKDAETILSEKSYGSDFRNMFNTANSIARNIDIALQGENLEVLSRLVLECESTINIFERALNYLKKDAKKDFTDREKSIEKRTEIAKSYLDEWKKRKELLENRIEEIDSGDGEIRDDDDKKRDSEFTAEMWEEFERLSPKEFKKEYGKRDYKKLVAEKERFARAEREEMVGERVASEEESTIDIVSVSPENIEPEMRLEPTSISAREHFRGLAPEAKMYVIENIQQEVWNNTIDKLKFIYSGKIYNWHERIAARVVNKKKAIDNKIKAFESKKSKNITNVIESIASRRVDTIQASESSSSRKNYMIELNVQKLENKKHRLDSRLFMRVQKRNSFANTLKILSERVSNRIGWHIMPFKTRLGHLNEPKAFIASAVSEQNRNIKKWEGELAAARKKLAGARFKDFAPMIGQEIAAAEANIANAKRSANNPAGQLKYMEGKIKQISGRVKHWEDLEKKFKAKVPKPKDYLKLDRAA